jgi:hypothetical protein
MARQARLRSTPLVTQLTSTQTQRNGKPPRETLAALAYYFRLMSVAQLGFHERITERPGAIRRLMELGLKTKK